MDSFKNYMTSAGVTQMRGELDRLLNEERPKIVETVSWAASNGDRSENGDYIYGKKRLREIDRRVRFLRKRLESAVVVDPAQQQSDRVLFGATVWVEDETGAEKCYRIVGMDESDAAAGKVSWVSPVGRALLQKKVGDEVTFESPKGDVELLIINLEYKEIE